MEIVQSVRDVLRSGDLKSFSKLVRVYRSSGLPDADLLGLVTEMDGYIAKMNVYARKPKDRSNFLLGLRKTGQFDDSQAWALGKKMSDYIVSLP